MSALRVSASGRSAASTIVVTQMRRRHLRAVLRIEERTSSTPWSLGLLLAEARRPERVYLVAREGSTVVGFAGLLFSMTEGHVTTIAVDPGCQGSGIGTRLMIVLLREAIARGATAITLEVRASNEAARALYRRFGFQPVGTRRGYYRNPIEDALVLWVHEVDSASYREHLDQIEAQLGAPVRVERMTGARSSVSLPPTAIPRPTPTAAPDPGSSSERTEQDPRP